MDIQGDFKMYLINKKKRLDNYSIFVSSEALVALAMGLFGPFWIVYIQRVGGSLESLFFAVGLMILAESMVAYFAGRLSDRVGRKIPMVVAGFVVSGIIVSYTLIDSINVLYVVQLFYGMATAIGKVPTDAFLADITKRESRGEALGRRKAITGILAGFAMIGGGLLAAKVGIEVVFYTVAGFKAISTVIVLLFIKEER